MNVRRRFSVTLLCALAVLALGASSAAALVVGVGDESPSAFTNTYFKKLGVKRTRLIVPYNAVSVASDKAHTDAWMKAARAAHEEIVVAFNPADTSRCPSKPCKVTSKSAFTSAFRAFQKRYPYVKIYQPWNEVNSTTQPTAHNPAAVVTYYEVVKKYCRGCTVLGADLEDLGSVASYAKTLKGNMVTYAKKLLADFKKAHVATPKIWGVHNYVDVNYHRSTGTRAALKTLPGQIWLTETGGLAQFILSSGHTQLAYSLTRQTKATKWLIQLANSNKRIARVYIYDLFYAPGNRFDSSLLGQGQLPRPAYTTLLDHDKRYFH